ncbi:MAG: lamin tail domain-containing protein [Almyronema sp.]
MKIFHLIHPCVYGILPFVGYGCFTFGSHAQAASLIPTEIMYDPNSDWNGDYNWIELYNPNEYDVDLSNYVFANQSGFIREGAGFIPKGSLIGARSTAILYGSVVRDPENDWGDKSLQPLPSLWDADKTRNINFIPVFFPGCGLGHSPYCEFYFRGQKMRFGLWSVASWDETLDFTKAYLDFSFERATATVDSSFPSPNDSSSIYLKDLALDPTDGSNWSLSVPGVDGAYAVASNKVGPIGEHPGPYGANDVGSPGYVPQVNRVPEPSGLLGAVASGLILGWQWFKSRNILRG